MGGAGYGEEKCKQTHVKPELSHHVSTVPISETAGKENKYFEIQESTVCIDSGEKLTATNSSRVDSDTIRCRLFSHSALLYCSKIAEA